MKQEPDYYGPLFIYRMLPAVENLFVIFTTKSLNIQLTNYIFTIQGRKQTSTFRSSNFVFFILEIFISQTIRQKSGIFFNPP